MVSCLESIHIEGDDFSTQIRKLMSKMFSMTSSWSAIQEFLDWKC